MPTLSRLICLLVFAGFGAFAGVEYQLLRDPPNATRMATATIATIAALSGWFVTGPRLDGRLLGGVFAVLQGVIVAAVGALVASATVNVFRLGYRTRYANLDEAATGFADHVATGAQRMADPVFLQLLGGFVLLGGPALALLFRLLEARRLR